MTTRVWDRFLTAGDKASLKERPHQVWGYGERPALVLIDLYRKVFGDRKLPLLEAMKEWPGTCGPSAWEAIPHVQRLLGAARAARIPIVHVSGLHEDVSGIPGWGDQGRMVRKAPSTDPIQIDHERHRYDIIDEVAPLPGEAVLRKAAPSGFFGTLLTAHLHAHDVDSIILCGESTSGCVRATCVEGRSYRFKMTVVEECVFDRHETAHAMNLFDMHQKYADVLGIDEVAAHLQTLAPRETSAVRGMTLLGRPVVLGRSAAASTGHPLASEAAIAIMREGGNAIDGAVAALAVLAVVKPDACALGSDLFLQVYDAKTGTVHALNASGPAGALATVESYGREIPHRGPRAVAVMGAVGGWEAALQRFGTRDLARVLAPAIGYARDGFPVSLHFAGALEGGRALLATDPGCAQVFVRDGRVPGYGELFRQPELAETLAAIASGGAQAFYHGAFARALDADMRARGGFLRADDLAGYEPQWKDSLRVRYRGYDVFEQPLISQGVIVLEAAKLLEGFDLASYGDRSADFVHLHTEAVKLAVADRQRYLGDPAFVDAPIDALLSDDFIAERRAALDPQRANANPRFGALLEAAADTSYGCTIDAQGNGVSFIQSIYEVWGSGYLVPGTGTLCNNRMTGFSLDPSHPNVLAPGKRTMHTLNTVVVCKDGQLRWLFGTPGAPAQVQSNTQLLTRVIDFGLNPQAAIEAPRAFWPQGAELMVEDPFGAAAFDELRRRGHQVVDLGPRHAITGGMEMIHVNEHGVREAGADPRREGYAIAY